MSVRLEKRDADAHGTSSRSAAPPMQVTPLRLVAALVVVGIVVGCRGGQSTSNGLATISPCPDGVTEVVVGRFEESCLRKIIDWTFTLPLAIAGYRDPVFEIDTPKNPSSLTALFGPESETQPILKVTVSKEGPVAVPTQRYSQLVNGAEVSFGTSSGAPAPFWRDDSGHSYVATLAGGNLDASASDKFAEQIAVSVAFP
jgi:hypothetical protein